MKIKPHHIVIGSGLLLAGGYGYRLYRTGKNLEVVPRLRIHKIDFKNLSIAVDATLKNPTAGGLKVNYPFVKLLHEEATIGSSQAKDQTLKIPAFGQVDIQNILIEIPLLNLTGVASDILDYIRGESDSMTIDIEVLTQAHTVVASIPVRIKEQFTIKRPKAA